MGSTSNWSRQSNMIYVLTLALHTSFTNPKNRNIIWEISGRVLWQGQSRQQILLHTNHGVSLRWRFKAVAAPGLENWGRGEGGGKLRNDQRREKHLVMSGHAAWENFEFLNLWNATHPLRIAHGAELHVKLHMELVKEYMHMDINVNDFQLSKKKVCF